MLSLSEYPESVRSSCMHVFTSCIVPLMGPSPSQYPAGTQPCSLMVDDHTPVELSFVMGSPLRMAARVYVEPLDAVTGSPAPQDSWLRSLGALGVASGVEHNDLSWSHICLKTLTVDASRVSDLVKVPRTQFAFGKCKRFSWPLSDIADIYCARCRVPSRWWCRDQSVVCSCSTSCFQQRVAIGLDDQLHATAGHCRVMGAPSGVYPWQAFVTPGYTSLLGRRDSAFDDEQRQGVLPDPGYQLGGTH
jgi:hypothetical protein